MKIFTDILILFSRREGKQLIQNSGWCIIRMVLHLWPSIIYAMKNWFVSIKFSALTCYLSWRGHFFSLNTYISSITYRIKWLIALWLEGMLWAITYITQLKNSVQESYRCSTDKFGFNDITYIWVSKIIIGPTKTCNYKNIYVQVYLDFPLKCQDKSTGERKSR